MKSAVHKLRVNVKSLAAEARFIRHEIRRTRDKQVKDDLNWHRTSRVRPEARMTHLALGFAKGRNYKVVESAARNEPSVADLTKKLNRFMEVEQTEVQDWLST